MPDSLIFLIESVNVSMDDEHLPMLDFKHIEAAIISNGDPKTL